MNLESLNNGSNSSDEISLKDIILKVKGLYRYLLSKWLIIFGFGVIGGVLGFTYASFKKPVYIAATTFVLEDGGSGGGLGQYAGVASMIGIDLGGGGGGIFQGDNIFELYKSRTMIEKTLLTEIDYQGKKQLMVDCYINFNNLREGWNNIPKLKNVAFTNDTRSESHKFTRLQDSILGIIVNDIRMNYLNVSKPDKKLSIIKAEVKSGNEFFSKAFNEHIVKNVNDFYVQTKTKKTLDNIAILQEKADSVRIVMNRAIVASASVTDATPNLNPTRQAQRIVPIQKSQFNAEASKSILGELVKNLEMSKLSLLKETPLIQVVDKPVLPLDKKNFGKLKGLILGGLLIGFLTVFFLLCKKIFNNIMA